MKNGPELWATLLTVIGVPGAVVAGGCIRDYKLGLEPKDYDIFVPVDTREGLQALADRLPGDLRLIEFECEDDGGNYAEYFKGVLIGVLEGDLLDYPVNIVARQPHLEGGTQGLIESFDFGILQCAYELGGHITQTSAFQHDLLDRTATLVVDRGEDLKANSHLRFMRFDERNPGVLRFVDPDLPDWSLSNPETFI